MILSTILSSLSEISGFLRSIVLLIFFISSASLLISSGVIDGSDFGPRLINVFKVLNQDIQDRSSTLDEDLKVFPYINGGLFAEKLDIPDFNHAMRDALLKAMELDWSQVSPAIFGSMFQGVMDEKQRRNLGAHYTSEVNILKVIKPLFLDDLYAEFAQVRHQKKKLAEPGQTAGNLA
jgi:hypothetical protein